MMCSGEQTKEVVSSGKIAFKNCEALWDETGDSFYGSLKNIRTKTNLGMGNNISFVRNTTKRVAPVESRNEICQNKGKDTFIRWLIDYSEADNKCYGLTVFRT